MINPELLTINVGGSSVRIGAHGGDGRLRSLERVDTSTDNDHTRSTILKDFVEQHFAQEPRAICHRIVHAGPDQTSPCVIDATVELAISAYAHLASLHNPEALEWIHVSQSLFGHKSQIAMFDTGLYTDLPDVAAQYAIPSSIGVRRMGFHGIAHQSMLNHLQAQSPAKFDTCRCISLQLGSGCSATASIGGVPIDTSMGYTPLEGLMMSTRAGDIDPGLILALQKKDQLTPDAIETLLSKHSGLFGVSGHSKDIRELLTEEDARSQLAINMYCYRIRKYIGAYWAAMGGLDAIVFGGGVGENQYRIRREVLKPLEGLGIQLDAQLNKDTVGKSGRISSAESLVTVDVVIVDENTLMAEEMAKLTSRSRHTPENKSGRS